MPSSSAMASELMDQVPGPRIPSRLNMINRLIRCIWSKLYEVLIAMTADDRRHIGLCWEILGRLTQ